MDTIGIPRNLHRTAVVTSDVPGSSRVERAGAPIVVEHNSFPKPQAFDNDLCQCQTMAIVIGIR